MVVAIARRDINVHRVLLRARQCDVIGGPRRSVKQPHADCSIGLRPDNGHALRECGQEMVHRHWR